MVTHNLGVAAYMSDYIIVMKKGRVVDAGTPTRHFWKIHLMNIRKQLKRRCANMGGGRLH
mgnify:CR=1 FL=1